MKKSFLSSPTTNEIIIVIIATIISINVIVLAFPILAQNLVKKAMIVGNLIALVLFVFYINNNRKNNRPRRSNNSSNHSSGNPSETGNSSSSNLDTTTTKTNEDRLSSEQLRHLSAPITQEDLSKYLQEYLPKYLQEHLPKYLEVLKKEDVTQDEKIRELEDINRELEDINREKDEKIREKDEKIREKDEKIRELEDIIKGFQDNIEKLVYEFNERNKDHFAHRDFQFLKLNPPSVHGQSNLSGSTIVQLVSAKEDEASYLKIKVDQENWLFPNIFSERVDRIISSLKTSIFTNDCNSNNPRLKRPAKLKLKDAESGIWEIAEPGEFI
jgi:hypothetical protein